MEMLAKVGSNKHKPRVLNLKSIEIFQALGKQSPTLVLGEDVKRNVPR